MDAMGMKNFGKIVKIFILRIIQYIANLIR